jgi:hypothetical protein
MNTQMTTSLDRFLAQQRRYTVLIRFLKHIKGPESLIANLQRDKARCVALFLLSHAFPDVLPHNVGNKRTVRRARPQAGSERAKSTTPAKKGK